ncbi:MAG: ubiquinol-cytochrome c reductase iron-sulfur subunit [Candidatus Coatesbacteria bacterium]
MRTPIVDPERRPGLSRRAFLTGAIAAVGGLIGAVLGGGGLGYVLSPLFRRHGEEWVDIGRADEVSPGAPIKVDFTVRKRDAWTTVERRASAWVLTADGKQFIVYDPRCTHLGCPYRWDRDLGRFLCPCHTAVFGVDGRVVMGPAPRPLDRFPVKIVGGRIMIRPEPVKSERS